jgi:putative membrane protein
MTLKKFFLICCLGGAFAFTACDKDDDDPIVPPPDEELNLADSTFLINAAHGNQAEIKTGELASTRGSTDSVKMFGQMLLTLHQDAQDELDSIASGENVNLPDTADIYGQAMYRALNRLSGAAFDSAFIKLQIIAHDTAIKVYQNYANAGAFTTLKTYTNKYIPLLQANARYLDSLKAQLPK